MNKKIRNQFILGISLLIISIGILVAIVFLIATSKFTLGAIICISLFYLLFAIGSVINLIETGKFIGIKEIAKASLIKEGSFPPINKNDKENRELIMNIRIKTKGHKIEDVVIE